MPVIFRAAISPKTNVTRKITRKIKNRIFAISAASAAIPPKPKAAAMREIMRNINDHFSIVSPQIAMSVRDR